MRYWNPNTESCYIEQQLNRLSEDIKSSLVEIGDWEWDECLRLNREEGKLIVNDPNTNHPTTVDPEPYVPTAEDEIRELKEYLESTDYMAIKCGELGLDMKTEYPIEYQKRLDARARINELEAQRS